MTNVRFSVMTERKGLYLSEFIGFSKENKYTKESTPFTLESVQFVTNQDLPSFLTKAYFMEGICKQLDRLTNYYTKPN